MNEISIYETPSGSIEVRLERETVWLSQEQMATLFDVQKAAVSKHLKTFLQVANWSENQLFPFWKQFSRKGYAE
ncbi:hypothetical protein [Nitrospira sp. M1]